MTTALTHKPKRRQAALIFAPFVLLIAAALIANSGLSVARDANAVPVTISATVSAGVWSESNSCGNVMNPPIAVNLLTFAGAQCDITFGISNATSNLFMVGDAAFYNQGGGFYTPTASSCGASLGLQRFGFKVGTAGEGLTANVVGAGCVAEAQPANGVADATNGLEWRPINTTAVNACNSPTIGTKVCPITVGIQGHTSNVVPAATYTGVLTFTAT